jgi:membrane protein
VLKAAGARAVAAMRRYARFVWGRDRAALGAWTAAWTRLARITTWSVRGVFVHRLSLQAAALAYYTLFSIVPVLVVALWVLKLFHLIPYLKPEEADGPAARAELTSANQFLREAVRAILAAVDRAGRLETGLVGLAALLYGVLRQVHHVEVALDTIAGARNRPAHYRRMLGYLALLALPPALLVVSGLLRLLAHLPLGSSFARGLSWLLEAAPLLRSAAGVTVGLGILCLALAIFYASAARARVAFSSAIAGGALGAALLAAVLWAFARLQIGVSRAGALESGMAAVPVFLLWAFSSWLVVLIGAQVAVAHELDGILIHGARVAPLEPYDEQMAGVQIMVEVARGARGAGDASPTTGELARRLRLLPESVRVVAGRLQRAGLLDRTDDGYRLACDPDRTTLRDVVGALLGRPDENHDGQPRRTGATLTELVEKNAASRARAAALSSNDTALSSE